MVKNIVNDNQLKCGDCDKIIPIESANFMDCIGAQGDFGYCDACYADYCLDENGEPELEDEDEE